VKRQLQAQCVPPGLEKYELAHGANLEAFRRKYAGLDNRELDKLANETAILAAKLRALVWERTWSVPTGN
jgi:hypothetical protein